ncbi:MAG: hypothetical protein AAGJ83_14800 [Planctomycetota bacterium]
MSLLAKGSAWLAKTMADHNSSGSEEGRKVTYLHGAHCIAVNASFGESEVEVEDTDGQLTIRRVRDFKINACELNVDGVEFEPNIDDRILEELTIGGSAKKWLYDVVKLPGKGTFDWVDHHRIRMRIFTERSARA